MVTCEEIHLISRSFPNDYFSRQHFPKYFPPLQFINLNFTLNYKADIHVHSHSRMVLFHHTLTFFPLNVTYQHKFTQRDKEYIKCDSMFRSSIRNINHHCFTSVGRSFLVSAERRDAAVPAGCQQRAKGAQTETLSQLYSCPGYTQLKEKGKVVPYAL